MTGDLNQLLNDICEKLGTTANLIIPEMAGYMIARNVIFLVFSVVLFIITGILVRRILKMYKDNETIGLLYSGEVEKLLKDERLQEHDVKFMSAVRYDEDDYTTYVALSIIAFIVGLTLLCIGLTRVIGWSIAPNAMMFKYIISALGGN